jgi:hypothetical protein
VRISSEPLGISKNPVKMIGYYFRKCSAADVGRSTP